MQLLLRQTTNDPAAWRAAMDADRESQGNAGLTLLQLWVDAGDPHTHWALFEVSDRTQAQGWVDGIQAGLRDDRAALTSSDVHFLKTA